MTKMTKGLESSSRRELRRARHHDLSRAQLLDAAEQVFGEKGFHDATLNEIAELAEYSVGSVYSFFEGKEDLFSQVFVRRGDEFMPGMRAIVMGTGSPSEKLERLVDFQVGFFRAHRQFGRLFLRYTNIALVSQPGELDASIARNYDESMQLQAELISAGQRAGEFHPGDPGVLAHLFSGLVASYQATDPSIVSDEPDAPERLSLEDLRHLVQRVFEV
jgi:TetR/AcrR family transcriptional regulator